MQRDVLDADQIFSVRNRVRDNEFDAWLAPGAPRGGQGTIVARVFAEESVADLELVTGTVVSLDIIRLGHVDLGGTCL
jgi:hypothetical protein